MSGLHSPQAAVAAALAAAASPRQIWVGYSGGVDSTALLLAATQWVSQQQNVALQALHANHQLHPQADHWASHCVTTAAQLGVTCHVEVLHVATDGNLEDAARTARYSAFARHVQSQDVLLLAHHAEDQTETLLLRLLQGRSLRGIRGGGKLNGMQVCRPFLQLTKQALTDYVRANGLDWIEDDSNQQTHFDRNFLRRDIIPVLRDRWPQMDGAVARVASYVELLEASLREQMRSRQQHDQPLTRTELTASPQLAVLKLREWLALYQVFTTTDKALQEFVRQCQKAGQARVAASPGYELYCRGEIVEVRQIHGRPSG